jgi:hypothetical protein
MLSTRHTVIIPREQLAEATGIFAHAVAATSHNCAVGNRVSIKSPSMIQ